MMCTHKAHHVLRSTKRFFGQIPNCVISSITTVQTQPIMLKLLIISLYFFKYLKLLSNAYKKILRPQEVGMFSEISSENVIFAVYLQGAYR